MKDNKAQANNPGQRSHPRREPPLLAALRRQAEALGHTQAEMAQYLGVTSGYFIMLRAGTRDVRHISLDFARACAAYLQTSTLNVLLLAGALDASDFSDPGTPKKRRIRRGLQALRDDPLYGAYVDDALLESLSEEAKQLLVSVYEEASQQDFGAQRALPPALQASLRLATVLDERPSTEERGDAALA